MWSTSTARTAFCAWLGLIALACGQSHRRGPDAGSDAARDAEMRDAGFISREVCRDVRIELPAHSCSFEEGPRGEISGGSLEEGSEAIRGCQYFHGSINLQDTTVTDVSFAESLVVIDGMVNLFRNRQMISLRGLQNLQSVNELYIRFDLSLPSLRELGSLRVVHGPLRIGAAPLLESLDGLERVVCVGELDLNLPGAVTSIDPLTALERVEGDVRISSRGIPRDELDAWIESVDIAGGIMINGHVVREAP